MKSGSPKISVIIPVYNAEPYLRRCLDSLLAQTFTDFELLLIDDGSRDCSGAVCDEYAGRDPRIKVFHRPNGGVSAARNVGLDHACGEWITFVDADDFVRERYLEHLLSHTGGRIDLVISYAEVFGNGRPEKETYPSRRIEMPDLEILFVENDLHWHTSPWSKLYRRQVIGQRRLRFCEGMHIGEDGLFLYTFMLASRTIFISSDTDYCYFACRSDSLTKRVNSLESEMLSYANIKRAVGELILCGSIRNPLALKNLNWLVASYQRRLLNALYHNDIGRGRRLGILHSEDWTCYTDLIAGNSCKGLILSGLLKCEAYRLYDWVRMLSVKMKQR